MSASTRITKAELARQLDAARHTIAELKLDRKILHEEIASLRGLTSRPATHATLRGFDVVMNGVAVYTAFKFSEANRICRATKLGSPRSRLSIERVVA